MTTFCLRTDDHNFVIEQITTGLYSPKCSVVKTPRRSCMFYYLWMRYLLSCFLFIPVMRLFNEILSTWVLWHFLISQTSLASLFHSTRPHPWSSLWAWLYKLLFISCFPHWFCDLRKQRGTSFYKHKIINNTDCCQSVIGNPSISSLSWSAAQSSVLWFVWLACVAWRCNEYNRWALCPHQPWRLCLPHVHASLHDLACDYHWENQPLLAWMQLYQTVDMAWSGHWDSRRPLSGIGRACIFISMVARPGACITHWRPMEERAEKRGTCISHWPSLACISLLTIPGL